MTMGTLWSTLRSPQGIISLVTVVVTVLSTIGIFTTVQSAAIQAVLTAVLGVLAAFTHTALQAKTATNAIVNARKARE